MTEIPHQSHLFGKFIIVSHYCSSLEAIHELRRVETEDLALPEYPKHSPALRATKSMRGIIHNLEIPP